MRVVDQPWKSPARCIVVSHITSQTENIRWVDTDGELAGGPRDSHIYVSDVGVRQLMSTLGYPMPMEFEALERRAEEAEQLAVDLLAKLEAAEETLAAIGMLEQRGVLAAQK